MQTRRRVGMAHSVRSLAAIAVLACAAAPAASGTGSKVGVFDGQMDVGSPEDRREHAVQRGLAGVPALARPA